jgi:hypothetical protein
VSVELGEHGLDVVGVGVDHGLDELILGLEVVVDVPDRHVGGRGDVRERAGLHALLAEDAAGSVDEALALAEF